MKRMYDTSLNRQEKALLVQAVLHGTRREDAEESLYELERLADTAGARVVGAITQRRPRPTSSFYIGEGKLADVQLACREAEADLVIFDNELSPIQVNNLDMALGIKVIDRAELILQIFARRARSAEAQIQVELAQLEYLVARVPSSERQHRFTGGIGMRGPGESPFQLRAAPMRKRISDLKSKLETVKKRRERTMQRRKWPVVCLVGYTNVGKSTLLNAMTAGDAYVDDRLFATLDTKTRLMKSGSGRNILLTDTVGFIRNLPHGLVASFRSTLDVAAEADLLLVVADASHQATDDQLGVVRETLAEIGAENVPYLLVWNKCDMAIQAAMDSPSYKTGLKVSALNGAGLEELKEAISNALSGSYPNR
jgi:GTP-binding protein HflX